MCCCSRSNKNGMMTDEMTSESSDVNVSSSINTTTAETVTASITGYASPVNPAIVRVSILLILTVFNLGGNGFTLMTIRLTPRLWTKTNFILASIPVANIAVGLNQFWCLPLLVAFYVFNDPCRYNVAIAALVPLLRIPVWASTLHPVLVSIERYIAIAHPLTYETKFSYKQRRCSARWTREPGEACSPRRVSLTRHDSHNGSAPFRLIPIHNPQP